MNYWNQKILREQLDSKLNLLKPFAAVNFEKGWVKTIREALGMSTTQLAKKVGIDQSRISRLENAETEKDLKLSSLKKIAEGLDMKFVYGFVPKESLETMMQEQARKIAIKRLGKVSHTMKVEDQELTDMQKANALEDLVQRILIEEPKNFWDK
jgi:predicted DNA-binding mobile mystery protein A